MFCQAVASPLHCVVPSYVLHTHVKPLLHARARRAIMRETSEPMLPVSAAATCRCTTQATSRHQRRCIRSERPCMWAASHRRPCSRERAPPGPSQSAQIRRRHHRSGIPACCVVCGVRPPAPVRVYLGTILPSCWVLPRLVAAPPTVRFSFCPCLRCA